MSISSVQFNKKFSKVTQNIEEYKVNIQRWKLNFKNIANMISAEFGNINQILRSVDLHIFEPSMLDECSFFVKISNCNPIKTTMLARIDFILNKNGIVSAYTKNLERFDPHDLNISNNADSMEWVVTILGDFVEKVGKQRLKF